MSASKKPKPDALSTYRAKRSVEKTPEPAGIVTPGPGAGGLFIVHMHAATRLHWDLRLEMEGVLKSWAVPRGPSRNPADKRLAVHVEDHPIEYGDFEGIIPEGNYGAGAVIVWDRGEWVPLEDPIEGLRRKGKLLFNLKGYKLKGRWTLVQIKKDPKNWLLIKERDAQVAVPGDDFPQTSVLSGLTVEQLKAKQDIAAALRAELKRLKAPEKPLRAKDVDLMLAETREKPFSKPGWVFELKLDGYRTLLERHHGVALLRSRNGHDVTVTYPEIAKAVAALPYDGLVMDTELVVMDDTGKPSFGRLQQRSHLTKPFEVRRAAVELPAVVYVFDLLAVEGFDLRTLPLTTRKKLLQRVLPAAGPLKYSEHFERDGEALFENVLELKLEGIVAKKADSPYRNGRSESWLKIRADKTDDFVVVGYSWPKGSRGGFGALHLAQYVDGELTYVGRAGSGFTTKQLGEVKDALEGTKRLKAPCVGPVPSGKDHTWVEPELVVEVRYKEITEDGLLRQPVFVRFRDDKRPEECERRTGTSEKREGRREKGERRTAGEVPAPAARLGAPPADSVVVSNLDKVFWPDEKYTKGDLIAYYRAISPWLLPYLKDRPVVLTRFPDGINGKSFFQKDAPGFAPEWLRTERMWSEQSQRELDYFVCDSEAGLVYLINMGTIPLHIWGSRVATLETPDWCILDLDPKGAPFANVVKVARVIKDLCDDIKLPAYIKTSGSSGLHVLLPMGRQCTFEQTRTLGGLLARLVASDLPDIATITRQVSRRDGRVYIDYVQNGHGRLLVAPFSARPVPGAWMSMPLKWNEVGLKLEIGHYTIKNAVTRMQKLKDDPLLPVLTDTPDLPGVLERLNARFEKRKKK
jgi:bifunctional non-homologous end joining protein LigD